MSWASHGGRGRSKVSKSMYRTAQLAHELPAVPRTLIGVTGKTIKLPRKRRSSSFSPVLKTLLDSPKPREGEGAGRTVELNGDLKL